MTKTHLSVWVLPRSTRRKISRAERKRSGAGAFIVASCKDAAMALVPPASGNLNRRLWPYPSPNGPGFKVRA